MYAPDEKTEELLNGYLDGYLSASEEQEIMALLDENNLVRQHLESLKVLKSDLRQMLQSPEIRHLNQSNVLPRKSNADLFQSVITEARQRAITDPVHAGATWVLPKQIPATPATLQHSDNRWIWAMAGLAASLIVAAGWLIQSRLPSDSINGQQGLVAQADRKSDTTGNKVESITTVAPESVTSKLDSVAMNRPIENEADREAGLKNPEPMALATGKDPSSVGTVGPIAPEANAYGSGKTPSSYSIAPVPSNSFVKPNTQPTAEQVAALENALKGSVNLSYLLVVDISLRDNEESQEILEQILTRYDIPSAVDMNVEESTLKKLAHSRLIASGKVVLPDSKPKAISNDTDLNDTSLNNTGDAEKAGLMFVKARGERLDAAIIEIMQRVDAFPEFSMDMAFDAPAQSLASELQFIQEAALPKNALIAKSSIASMLSSRYAAENGADNPVNLFRAPQRRGLPLATEKRLSGKGPNGLGAEMMNPISCAIIILREAK